MTETELNRLRKELADNYREFQKEEKKLEDIIKTPEGMFESVRERRRNQAKVKLEKLHELMKATEDFQKAIATDSTKSVSDQMDAYKKMVELEDSLNFKKSNCSYNVNRPLYNTLITHHNRSIKKNAKTIKGNIGWTFLKALPALACFAAQPVLAAIGLGAMGAALATPLAWLGGGFIVRAGVHCIQGFARHGTIKGFGVKSETEWDAKYDELYPTQSKVKGFFRTLGYNRSIKKTAGKMFTELGSVKEYKNFKGAEITRTPKPEEGKPEDEREEEKGRERGRESEDMVNKFIEMVKNTEIKKVDDIDNLEKTAKTVIPYATDKNKELFSVVHAYLNLARKVLGKVADEEYTKMLEAFVKEDAYKTEEAKALQGFLVGKLVELAKSIGAYDTFIKPFYGEERKPEERKPEERKPEEHTPEGGKPGGDKPEGDKPEGGKPAGDKPEEEKANDRDYYEYYDESYAGTLELSNLLNELRNFNVSRINAANYNRANRIISRVELAKRINHDKFFLNNDDEMKLAEIVSMADAYESKSQLVEKLKICEAAMDAKVFYKEAFEDCIKEFYNIVGHTTFGMHTETPSVKNTEFGPLYKPGESVIGKAQNTKLLSQEDYQRVKAVLEYYKKYSALTRTSGFADYQVQQEENLSSRSR